MKLTKLFLLLPAFAMVACANNPVNSSEAKDDSLITEEEFDAIFQDLKLFKEDNVIMTNEISFYHNDDEPEKNIGIVQAENGKVSFRSSRDAEKSTGYVDFVNDEYFDYYSYEDGEWEIRSVDMSKVTEFFFNYAGFVPFAFKDVKRDEENKTYVIDEADIGDYEAERFIVSDGVFTFKDGKPISLSFEYRFNVEDDPYGAMTATFEYGKAHVVIPSN